MPLRIWVFGLAVVLLSGCASKSERDYMTGCVSSGASKDVCSCTYDSLKASYSEAVFEDIDKGIIPQDFMEKTAVAMKQCT